MLDRLRDPAHTGDRRCWPCTVLNCLLLAVGYLLLRRRSRVGAALAGFVGVAAIALRGYLVPYTPRFAPALIDRLPVDYPRAELPEPGSLGDAGDALDGEAVAATLVDAGVLVADGDTLSLDSDFEKAWRAEMREVRALSNEALADRALSVSPAADVAVEDAIGRPWIVLSDGSASAAGQAWLSRPVAIADVAATRALDGRTDGSVRRAQVAGTLRAFLTACPACGGPVEETTTADCCGDPRMRTTQEVLACQQCDVRLFSFED